MLAAVWRAVTNLSGFVLGDFVLRMLLAVLAFAVSAPCFWYVHLYIGRVLVSKDANVPISISFQRAPARGQFSDVQPRSLLE